MIQCELIVVGGGLAGLRAAVEAKAEGIDVAVLSQVWPGRSHSGAAQGGVNAALANHPESADDTWEKHAFDTVKGSDYLADQDAVAQMTKDAIPVIYDLDHWGCPFSRFDNGTIAQRPFGRAIRAPATAPIRPVTICCTPWSSRPSRPVSPCTWSGSSAA